MNVYGYDVCSGLVGHTFNSNITNSYSTGTVTAVGSYAAGLATGENLAEYVYNSFWDMESSGQTYSDCGTGKTTAEMKTQSTYTDAGWDFSAIWAIDPAINNGYPYLNNTNSVPTNDPSNSITSTSSVLHAAYPNPFNPSTTLSFDVPNNERISINIYNVKGQLVKNICNQVYDKGYHSIIWNGKDNNGTQCGTGVYFYKMQTDKTTQTKKMMMIK